jgi:hypothetical protein
VLVRPTLLVTFRPMARATPSGDKPSVLTK